jgi:hypothetical protein
MDIVTDLTAETTSYIVLLQDILKCNQHLPVAKKLIEPANWAEIKSEDFEQTKLTSSQEFRINDLLWISKNTFSQKNATIQYFEVVTRLLNWVPTDKIDWDNQCAALYHSPFFWRRQVRKFLFEQIEQRVILAAHLEYMPLQVVMVLAEKGKEQRHIRLFQIYHPTKTTLINPKDRDRNLAWWTSQEKDAIDLLLNDSELLSRLKAKGLALPFETLFGDELKEIAKVRAAKQKDLWASGRNQTEPKGQRQSDTRSKQKETANPDTFDPLRRAADMHLMGIAFSGGGIRSATFNLGILQKLASLKLLHHFDYLSTVSGGGYIGTWLESWIKRATSVSKVADRLCPDKSGDPLADEVRPIRWLRMFSNYLSPNVGIMSPDAWASGMTWLRNTLINQFVLLLILLSLLAIIYNLYEGWLYAVSCFNIAFSPIRAFVESLLILFPGALAASIAMHSFDPPELRSDTGEDLKYWERIKQIQARAVDWANIIPGILLAWAALCALIVSIRFYVYTPNALDLGSKIAVLWPCFFSCLTSFIILAFGGNYHKRRDLRNLGRATVMSKPKQPEEQRMDKQLERNTTITIWGSSILASAACVLFLSLAWVLIQYIKSRICFFGVVDDQKLVLVTGVPIVLEVLSLTVIVRMAIMGNLFPDYRREWWGRIGGLVHRFILIWILVSTACLILPDIYPPASKALFAAWGGWAGIVGWGVKKAFESKEDKPGDKNKLEGLLIKIVPYIFMIGFLLIGSWITGQLRSLCPLSLKDKLKEGADVIETILLILITLFLSWRIGVNEFSLHHFYRNRLTRAYLGATRTREDRIKTANAFTGFDTNDDLLLSSFLDEDGYQGPYPIINTALNATVVSALDRQDRKAESFVFSPLYCGYDFSPTRSSTYNIDHVYEYGYRPTDQFSNENGGPTLGTAMAISGAAVNPNWGYHSSSSMAFLLTLFNVRLGWWIGNPRREKWKNAEPRFGLMYLIQDLIGKSDINTNYVCLSDGGHFDNMGLYELIRRRCHYIILGDGEQDDDASCEGLANAIRRCRIDFGVEIELILSPITEKGKHAKHLVKGTIKYPGSDEPEGTLIYIKTSLIGNESVDIRQYALANKTFPQQSTGDQFFDEAQFESYRKLGYQSIDDINDLYLPWMPKNDSKNQPEKPEN